MGKFIKVCLLLLGIGGVFYWFINKDIITLKEIDKEMAVEMSKKMVELEKKYNYPTNQVNVIEGCYIVDINNVNDNYQISYSMGYGVATITDVVLAAKIKIDSAAFDLDDYPVLKEALAIIYGSKSTLPKNLESKIEEGTKTAVLDKYNSKLIDEDGDTFVLVVEVDSQNSNGYNLTILCMRSYEE